MRTHDSYTLHITPLAPVHIGTGESYEPTQYVIDDEGILHEFDTGAVMAALDKPNRDRLLKIAQDRPGPEMIKSLQRFFHERREHLIPWSINRVPTLHGFSALYASRVGQSANVESGGGQVLNKLEIDRFAYQAATRKPVLYGSSLKGSLRTALLNSVNGKRTAREHKGLHDLQGRLFHYRDLERDRTVLERDPLRLVQLGDAPWQGPADWPAGQIYLAVNRKKERVKDKHGREIQAMGENLYQILECVPAWRYRAFGGKLNLQRLDAAPPSTKLPDPALRFSIDDIVQACNDFYQPLLIRETTLLQTRGYLSDAWADSIAGLLGQLNQRERGRRLFLARIGRHSGAEAVTLEGMRRIRIMKGKGQPPDQADAAKTLWLAANDKDQRADLLPFGWVLIEVTDGESDVPAWPELEALCAPWQEDARRFAEREQVRRAAQTEWRASREAEAEETRRRLEEEAARAAAEATRLASLSVNQQRVEDLLAKQIPANRRQGPGSQLYGELRSLLQEAASDWELNDRKALQAVAVAIFEHLGIAKDNKNRKALLRGLDLAGIGSGGLSVD